MKTLEKQAKTVDEAIELALEELKVSRNEVEVEIIEEETEVFWGLSKLAKVKVMVKPNPEEIAYNFLKGILRFIDEEVKISSSFNDNVLKMQIEVQKAGIIIGKHGSTLDSLQYLTSLVVNRNTKDYVRVILDAENYREKREKTLERLAKRMAEKVKDTKRSITLEPMYPNERRLIHTALQKDPGVTTKSVGQEPNRRVIISLR